jgi:large subunit ribosomal protein L32e
MAIKKRKHPKFRRPNYGRSSRGRIGLAWRRPRGIDNKKRLKIAYMGASPSIGYGQPAEIRGFHPSGMPEALVQSPSELSTLSGVLIRIAGGVGRKKREIIEKLAKEKGLRVLNPARERAKDRAKKERKAAALAAASAKKKAEEQKKEAERKAAEEKRAADAKKAQEAEEKKAADAKKAQEAAEKKAAGANPAAQAPPQAARQPQTPQAQSAPQQGQDKK